MTSSHQILDKHIIVDVFCSKWTSHRISHLRLCLRFEIALRNPFSQNKSTIVYIYWLVFYLACLCCHLRYQNKFNISNFYIRVHSTKVFGMGKKILSIYLVEFYIRFESWCTTQASNSRIKCTHDTFVFWMTEIRP